MGKNKEPHWTTSKWESKCQCGASIEKGEDIFYYPIGRRVMGSKCGCAKKAADDFRTCNCEAY